MSTCLRCGQTYDLYLPGSVCGNVTEDGPCFGTIAQVVDVTVEVLA